MSYAEIENEILRRKQKAIFDAVAELKKRAKAAKEIADGRHTAPHDSIMAYGQALAYADGANYLENILKK